MTEYRRHNCPLHEAIRLDDEEAIKAAHDKDAFAIFRPDAWDRFPVESAFRGKRLKAMRALIDCGATAQQGSFLPLDGGYVGTLAGREALILLFLGQILNTDESGIPKAFLEMDAKDDDRDGKDLVECRRSIISAKSGAPYFTLHFSVADQVTNSSNKRYQEMVEDMQGVVIECLREAKARGCSRLLDDRVDEVEPVVEPVVARRF